MKLRFGSVARLKPGEKMYEELFRAGDIRKDTDHSEIFVAVQAETDMVRGAESGLALIEKWLRNKNTIEFLGIWEEINNPGFNSLEFEGIKNQAGLNRFVLSVKQWVVRTSSKGILARAGRYGGTYAHKDIAFEFAAWLSPKFKLYLIKEFQRLKQDEAERVKSGWSFQRALAKVNYRIHTDAIKRRLIASQAIECRGYFSNEGACGDSGIGAA